ncbi:PleD family two-component system response regulator [Desulforhopalus sp. IMCC35007]|uniref:response regulator n=1 Tax=Desulforhopalus sp. IMCC35007 TaxID=2569543 RepID=UPI0010AEC08F|nr:response regulator [Desulforhopalus sp. IMCC35007]TKB09876.1 response regulator [Desulforhopalus sp. IMCC35007]
MAAKLILIVEDSPTDRKIAESVCLDQGYRTVVVTEGDKVLAIATEQKPDLILLDVILPNKNGFQVCRQLKNNEATKDTKIVIVSSKDQASDKFWGLKQGADDYLTKPYKEQDLIAVIEKNI